MFGWSCCGWGLTCLHLPSRALRDHSPITRLPALPCPACSLKVNKGSSSRYITSATHFNRDKGLKVGALLGAGGLAAGWLSQSGQKKVMLRSTV